VRRLRHLYAERLAALTAALAREMPEGTTWMTPRSGLLVWVTLPPRLDPDRLHQAALARGVAFTRGETFYCDGRGAGHVALSFAALAPAAIAEGIARLGAVMREHMAAPAARSGGRHRVTPARTRARRRADAAV
jgi:2-aminoadipate transaminase